MKFCQYCFERIPDSRLKILPDTSYCVKHSQEKGYYGLQEYPHKTGGFIVKTKGDNEEGIRQMQRAYKRAR